MLKVHFEREIAYQRQQYQYKLYNLLSPTNAGFMFSSTSVCTLYLSFTNQMRSMFKTLNLKHHDYLWLANVKLDTQDFILSLTYFSLFADKAGETEYSWGFVWVVILGLAVSGVAGYALYKYRIRVSLAFSFDRAQMSNCELKTHAS